ncbi:hypothetical protein [Halobacterium litoreum]|uniref:Uncharacterized protein n=1 Tax=Halobacterium litoreum TaxID=2039234 RepID=A0ABD5NES9_9EURY|nr:hypothetical protein [Halobacterium litoreum]UHH13473.1 hypothetical protein LT972_00410 [Halobacterium litoreum]
MSTQTQHTSTEEHRLSRDPEDTDRGWSDGQWDAERFDLRADDPEDDGLGGQIAASDCDSAKWDRLRRLDEGWISYDGREYDHEEARKIRNRAVDSDGRTEHIFKMHRADTVCDRLNVRSATRNETRQIVARTDCTGHSLEKVITGAAIVARDAHVATRLAQASESVDEPLSGALRRLDSLDDREGVGQTLDNLAALADDDGPLAALLERRLVDDPAVVELAEEYGFSIENARAVHWEGEDDA